MEQLVVLLVIAAISFINWLIKKSAEQREKRRRMAPPPIERQDTAPSADPETWRAPEDDIRKFMEALGLPPEAEPVAPKRWEPPAAEVVSIPAPPPLPVAEAVPMYQAPKVVRPSAEALALAKRLQAKEDPIQAGEIGRSPHVREMLRSPRGLRDAMVLKEILAEPRCLRPF